VTGVGVIGIGALGHCIANLIAMGSIPGVELTAIAARASSQQRLEHLAETWHCRSTTQALELPSMGAEFVVEAAGVGAARQYTAELLRAGSDVVLMSTGALVDPDFVATIKTAAAAARRRVHLPSGAIAGLDGLLAAMESGVTEARITTRKHPDALRGAPYLDAAAIDVDRLQQAEVVFRGNAREAIAGFPANVNVAVTVAMAVGDLERVRVEVVADPAATSTVHRIEVTAPSGTISVELSNRPSPDNPRSSWLAALSAVATIRRTVSSLQVG
jgi:aspartate dehydrogenase